MFFLGLATSNRTNLLINKYCELLNNGCKASEILVIVQNSTMRKQFIDKVMENLSVDCVEKLEIHSFFSLAYNTVLDNWAFLEERNIYDNPVILPNLSGLEVSQFILKDILKEIKFKGYNSRMSLLQQIFRRYSLIVQNNLTPNEVERRAKILKEGFSDDASRTINKLLRKTLELRAFDYLRQCLLFNFIYQNTDYFKNIKYLFVDDADECSPACIDFISYLRPQINDYFIGLDPLGSSRCGYLSADKSNYTKLKKMFGETKITETNHTCNKIFNDIGTLYQNVQNGTAKILENFSYISYSKRSQIIEFTVNKVKELLSNGINPNEISIITPIVDDMLKFSFKENLNCVNLMFLTGSEKLIHNKFVRAAITLLKLNTKLRNTLSEFDIRIILSDFLQIPLKYCHEILKTFELNKNFSQYEFKDKEYTLRYSNLLDLVKDIETCDKKISEQIIEIYKRLFNFKLSDKYEINKFNFFIKQIIDFENVFGLEFNKHKTDIILQVENSIISENPYSVTEISHNDLVISTPQKIIDNRIQTKYQFWLDVSNSEWEKSDTGPLYNAWVFQKDWDKDEYTLEDNIKLSKDKTARGLRKLASCATEHIYCCSSLFDSNGIENYGAIEEFLITDEAETEAGKTEQKFKITPREDQKPVLKYKNGYMGISAVPGAGKTTILLALIIKLLENKVNPEHIFVLTYMDSAARNFRERIKNIYSSSSKMPNISTIHGLALRILKENGNFARLGLAEDFEICDDIQRTKILKDIGIKLNIKSKTAEEFDRAISVFKMAKGEFSIQCKSEKLKQFQKFYNQYQAYLKNLNLIDYDDMLLGAVELLENNTDILAHYQNICEFIIEDEAQDSSAIQQRLIKLLSCKHKNVIRCGDVNQSITATFSNSDVDGFKKFITKNNNVSMNCSQRCTKDIWECANKLVKSSITHNDKKNAFFEMYMAPVSGKNPVEHNAITTKILDTEQDEKNYILKIIKNTMAKHPDYTVGILLRNNYQVATWQSFIENNGFKVITRNQCLEQKTIFKAVFAVINIILHPFDNTNLADNYNILAELGVYKQKNLGAEIKKYENPFIQINCDCINNISLEQFYWDVNYWITLTNSAAHELVIKIAKDLHLLNSDIDRANIYLISTLIKRINLNNNSLDYVANRLAELAKRPNLNGFKFFSEEDDEENKKTLQGKIQIMTMHKSKGDEFNLVFLPEMTEKNLPFDINGITLKSSDFFEDVKSLNPTYKRKSEYELKQEVLAENLRLLYVAITRAKNKLIITTSKRVKNYGKMKNSKPNPIFEELFSYVEGCN